MFRLATCKSKGDDMDKPNSRQMKALKIAEDADPMGIWAYMLKEKGWVLSTAHVDLAKLHEFCYLQKTGKGERGKIVYRLAPYLHILTKNPVDLSIKTVSCKEASQASLVSKFVAAVPGTALMWGSPSWQ